MSGKREPLRRGRRFLPLTAYHLPLTLGIAACAVTPLSNRIGAGQEAFVIAVGEGTDGRTDLFAAPAGGGTFLRLTFTRAAERFPKLSPAGTRVAFVRDGGRPSSAWTLVVLDLLTNQERRAPIPADAGAPARIGWRADGGQVALATDQALFTLSLTEAAAPLVRVSADAAIVESRTREHLGTPPSATIMPCDTGELCVAPQDGSRPSPLDPGARDAIRWGGDSVGYFTSRGFQVRPLAGGTPRRPAWSRAPAGLRQLSYHPGQS